jgi:serine/threonine-protein kinase
VLYEMLAGEPPHAGPSALAVIARRLSEPAGRVRARRSDVPVGVDRALSRALARDPADRFVSAAAFAGALVETGAVSRSLPSVAVLPFRNLSADPENEYFADGITEDVIAQLAKIRALKVISRTSVMKFKNGEQTLHEIGAALEVTTVLTGSVRRAAERVRVVAQLIDVESERHLWAETYDRRLTDIFVIQTDVALHIAAALRAELSRDERLRIGREPTRDLEAYQLYLQGRHHFIRFTEEGLRKSIELYERAITKDPDYAMAHVGLALAHMELGETGAVQPELAHRGGREAARRALELDPELGEAHSALAVVSLAADYDFVAAERGFKRALELTPSSADAYDLYGKLCSALERYDEALAMQRRARALDPLAHPLDFATTLLRAGSFDEALEAATRAIEIEPGTPRGQATVGWALILNGRHDEGLAHLETAASLAPGETAWLAQLGQARAMVGDTDEARDVLRRLEELAERRYVSPYHLAYVHTGLGERDRAIDYLERAYEQRAGAVYGIKGSFLFRPLHGHPRFTALLGRMNLA